ncbi:MAG: VOC family protein [Planctomycetales bacterium]|nr:VOC family protein [Planctomycetales bacterium]
MSPAPLAPGPLNHVALPTADPEVGARFYGEVLGFQQTPRPGFSFRGAWLWRPETGVMIHLIHDERFRRPTGPLNTRTSHLALQTPDYDRSIEQLRAHGVEFVERVLPDYGYRQVFFQDPDGNVIELGEWPAPEEMLSE